MGGCCFACLKYLVMVFNLVYMLLGLLLQGTMLWIYFDAEVIVLGAKEVEGYNWVIFMLMGIGTVITIMGFLGCCGALQESQCMLATFFALVLVLFAGQVAACAWIYDNSGKFSDITVDSFRTSFQRTYNYDSIKTKAMDKMQKDLRCCGAAGPEDWSGARFNNEDYLPVDIGISGKAPKSYHIPASCCHSTLGATACDAVRQVKPVGTLKENIYSEGCARKIIKIIESHNWIIIVSLFVVAFIEILAMIFSMVLCCTARRIDQYKA